MKKLKVRKCTLCGCTDARACEGGCCWIDDDVDICSSCYFTPLEVSEVMPLAGVKVSQKEALSWTIEQRHAAIKWAAAVRAKAAYLEGRAVKNTRVPKVPPHVEALQSKATPTR